MRAKTFLACAGVASVLILGAERLSGQRPPQDTENKPAEAVFKNIQVLKGMPADRLIPTMTFMAASLGVNCEHCHVDGPPGELRDKDDKEEKGIARRMIVMMRAINRDNFDDKLEVTCATCHQGRAKPDPIPAIAEVPLTAAPAPAPAAKDTTPLPSVDQVVARYLDALGGRAALERVTTRVMKGTVVLANGTSRPIELHRQSPDKMLDVTTLQAGTSVRGYNGSVGWLKDPTRQARLEGPQLDQVRRLADFYWDLRLRERYRDMLVSGREKALDREAYAVDAVDPKGGRERLFFDTETGLLLRRVIRTRTPLGIVPEQTDFGDYRAVAGVKVPFIVRRSTATASTTQRFTEVKLNAPLSAAEFEQPAAPSKQ